MMFKVALVVCVVALLVISDADACGGCRNKNKNKNKSNKVSKLGNGKAFSSSYRDVKRDYQWTGNPFRVTNNKLRSTSQERYRYVFSTDECGIFNYVLQRVGNKYKINFVFKVNNGGRVTYTKSKPYMMKSRSTTSIRNMFKKFRRYIKRQLKKQAKKNSRFAQYFTVRDKLFFKSKRINGKNNMVFRYYIYVDGKLKDKKNQNIPYGEFNANTLYGLVNQYKKAIQQSKFTVQRTTVNVNGNKNNNKNQNKNHGTTTTTTTTTSSQPSVSTSTTNYASSFNFQSVVVDGKNVLRAECEITKDGKHFKSLKKDYPLVSFAEGNVQALVAHFKSKVCDIHLFVKGNLQEA